MKKKEEEDEEKKKKEMSVRVALKSIREKVLSAAKKYGRTRVVRALLFVAPPLSSCIFFCFNDVNDPRISPISSR